MSPHTDLSLSTRTAPSTLNTSVICIPNNEILCFRLPINEQLALATIRPLDSLRAGGNRHNLYIGPRI